MKHISKKKSWGTGEFRKAELKFLADKKKKDSSGSDLNKLLHELQVHKAELERQNEELRLERDRAEDANKKYSDLYSEIYDFTPIAYFSLTREGEILQLNKKASELLGRERSYLISQNFMNFLPEEMRITLKDFLREVFEKPGKVRYEIKINKSDHSVINCVLEGTLSEFKDYCIAIVVDINELKPLEPELRDTQVKLEESTTLAKLSFLELENIYRNVPVGLCVLDLNLKYIRVNNRLAEINGIPAHEHIGKQVKDIVPAFHETAEKIVKSILNTGEPRLGVEFIGKSPATPDEIRSWSEDWLPLKDSMGRIVGINVSVIETTTERRAKEQLLSNEKKLTAAMAALERSQKKLNITLKNAKIGTWEWDLRSHKVSYDKRTQEILGLKEETYNGELIEDLVHEDDLIQVKKTLEKSVAGEPWQLIYRTKPVEGKFKYISASSVLIRDRLGHPKIISGVLFDITDLKTGADETLKKMHEDLTRSNNDLMHFAYIVSHDLQEPLRMITSFTQLLQMQYKDALDDKANEYIRFAVEGSKRMYDLLNGLLSYSRVHTRGSTFVETSLNDVVVNVTENLRLLIAETGAELIIEELPVINADVNQMTQLMQNLIDNSIKFCETKPVVRISSRSDDGMHIISVSDNGIGIDPQYFSKIFKIFQRLHLKEHYKGTGIGLALCKKIVERHGGELWLESTPGKGSTFFFSFPR